MRSMRDVEEQRIVMFPAHYSGSTSWPKPNNTRTHGIESVESLSNVRYFHSELPSERDKRTRQLIYRMWARIKSLITDEEMATVPALTQIMRRSLRARR